MIAGTAAEFEDRTFRRQQCEKALQPQGWGLRPVRIGLRIAPIELQRVVVHDSPQLTASVDFAARSLWIGKTQHQPHVLDRGARGAFAQIVETRDENRLMVFVAGKNIELEPVRLVERLGLELPALGSRVLE